MKKVLIVLLSATLFFSCQSNDCIDTTKGDVSIVDDNGVEKATIEASKLKDVLDLANSYSKLTDGKVIPISDITIEKIDEGNVKMFVQVDENITLALNFNIDSKELEELRRTLATIKTAQPVITHERIKKDLFKFTFHVGNKMKYSTLVEVTNLKEGWSWFSYVAGVLTVVIPAIFAIL